MGTNYLINFHNKKSRNCYGATNIKNKVIDIYEGCIVTSETLFHELYHAFFYECGLDDYWSDEILVHAIGRITPKVFLIFKSLMNECGEMDANTRRREHEKEKNIEK